MAKLPPTPVGVPPGHSFWNDWYEKLRNLINNNLQNHNDLQNIQGGSATERYHLTSAQSAALATLTTTSTFTPVVEGSGTAGAGTYTTQLGYYKQIDDLVYFHLTVTWTAHTGTSNIRIAGLPVTSLSGVDQTVGIIASSLTFATQLAARVMTNNTRIDIRDLTSAGSSVGVALPSAGTVVITGFYFTA